MKARRFQVVVATSKFDALLNVALRVVKYRCIPYYYVRVLLCACTGVVACIFLIVPVVFIGRYFGAARQLPGVRELFEDQGKREMKLCPC